MNNKLSLLNESKHLTHRPVKSQQTSSRNFDIFFPVESFSSLSFLFLLNAAVEAGVMADFNADVAEDIVIAGKTDLEVNGDEHDVDGVTAEANSFITLITFMGFLIFSLLVS